MYLVNPSRDSMDPEIKTSFHASIKNLNYKVINEMHVVFFN
jgi:hypothetical protein